MKNYVDHFMIALITILSLMTACMATVVYAECDEQDALMNGYACTDDETTISHGEVRRLAAGAGWTESEMEVLMCIIQHESSFRPGVQSYPGQSWGLTQIHEGFWLGFGENDPLWPELNPQVLMDPAVNLKYAKMIKDRSSWKAWSVYEVYCDG